MQNFYFTCIKFCEFFVSLFLQLVKLFLNSNSVLHHVDHPVLSVMHTFWECLLSYHWSHSWRCEWILDWAIDPWGTTLVSERQLNFVPLMILLWAQWSSQFSIYSAVCLLSLYLTNLAIIILWGTHSCNTCISWYLLEFHFSLLGYSYCY